MKKNVKPPWLAKWLLYKLKNYQENYSIVGDLEEAFNEISARNGYFRAACWYRFQCTHSVYRYFLLTLYWSIAMFKNYLKLAFRNLARHKTYTAINILGLSIGLAFCILTYLYVTDELSYDRFHKNADSIYSVVYTDHHLERTSRSTTFPMGPAMEEFFPEIKYSIRLYGKDAAIRYNEKIFKETMELTDPEFFKVFSFPLIEGNPETVLQSNSSVVLTRSTVLKYFGDKDPLGKTVTMIFGEKQKEFTVTGVSEDAPANSTIKFDFLINVENIIFIRGQNALTDWNRIMPKTYIRMNEGVTTENTENRFPAFVRNYFSRILESRQKSGRWDGKGETISFSLQSIKDMHLDSSITGGNDIKNSYILASIALLVLIIASINFMNLSIGKASGRAVEIGMRKVLGAERRQLVRQFWSESLLMVFIALIFGLLFASFLLPVFNNLANKNLELQSIADIPNLSAYILLMIIAGVLSGSFPALIMSGFQPIDVLKGKIKVSGRNFFTRSLVIVQFSVSVFLIVSTLIMTGQINFMNKQGLGFNQDGIVVIETQEREVRKSESIVDIFKELPDKYELIKNVTGCQSSFNRGGLGYSGTDVNGENVFINYNRIHYDYLNTMEMKLIEGRDFSREFSGDKEAVIINQTLVKKLELDNPVGKTLRLGGFSPLQIIGIVEDYNFRSLKYEIEPAVLVMDPSEYLSFILVRISQENIYETVGILEKTWKEVQPDKSFEFSFLDEDIERVYNKQKKWNMIVRYSSFFALLITCMGIFGLTSIIINRRVKEIGIRKVLGATVPRITKLIIKDFIILVIFANIITWPLSYYFMNNWLQGFAYRVTPGLLSFAFAGILTLFIALISVIYQSVRAATANPVESLRYE